MLVGPPPRHLHAAALLADDDGLDALAREAPPRAPLDDARVQPEPRARRLGVLLEAAERRADLDVDLVALDAAVAVVVQARRREPQEQVVERERGLGPVLERARRRAVGALHERRRVPGVRRARDAAVLGVGVAVAVPVRRREDEAHVPAAVRRVGAGLDVLDGVVQRDLLRRGLLLLRFRAPHGG